MFSGTSLRGNTENEVFADFGGFRESTVTEGVQQFSQEIRRQRPSHANARVRFIAQPVVHMAVDTARCAQ